MLLANIVAALESQGETNPRFHRGFLYSDTFGIDSEGSGWQYTKQWEVTETGLYHINTTDFFLGTKNEIVRTIPATIHLAIIDYGQPLRVSVPVAFTDAVNFVPSVLRSLESVFDHAELTGAKFTGFFIDVK